MSDGDRKQGKSLCQQLLRPLFGNLQLAKRRFDRYLEEGSGANERLLRTGDRFSGSFGKTRVIA